MATLDQAARQIAEMVQTEFIKQLNLQGHKLTGSLANSIDYKIKLTGVDITITFEIEQYGLILDKGTPASRIPFGGNTGKKTSKYIEGLKRYARLRFFASEKEATKIAFAIANKQKYGGNGMPTFGSFKFSKTGKRTGFIDATLKASALEIEKILTKKIEFEILVNVE